MTTDQDKVIGSGQNNIVQYGTYEIEAAEEEAAELKRSPFMKLEVGQNIIRILPPPLGKRSPFVTTYQHFIRVPHSDQPVVFNCPRLMAHAPCPACAKAQKLELTGNLQDVEAARKYRPNRRIFCNVIDRSDEDAGPKVLAFGRMIHEDLIALRRNPDAGGDFTDPTESGFDIIIERKGTGLNDTSYKVFADRRASPLGDMEWINEQMDLEQFSKVPTLDEIKAMVPPPPSQPERQHERLPAYDSGYSAQSDVQGYVHADDDPLPF